MSIEKSHKATVHRYFREIFNKGNIPAVDQLFVANGVYHDPTMPAPLQGVKSIKQFFTDLRTAFPDISVTVDELVADENRVAARWTRQGSFTNSLAGMPANGKAITVNGLSMFHFNDKGGFVEVWVCFDTLRFQQELEEVSIVFGRPTQ